MGAMLSSPVELIRVQRHGNQFYRAAVADMQGWRMNHEDGHDIRCESGCGSFWVLDGHGGDGCARYCSPKIGEHFANPAESADDERIWKSFEEMDDKFRRHVKEFPDQDAGSTCVGSVAQRQDDGSYNVKIANCGDSRGLIVRGPDAAETCTPLEVRIPAHLVALKSTNVAAPAGANGPDYKEPNKGGNPCFGCRWPVIAESVDHKPNHPTELARITAAGGYVSPDEPARLDGNLAVSRCLGDFEYKGNHALTPADQKCSVQPDIYEVNAVPAGSFLILACDGLWDVCTGEYVATYIRDELKKNPDCDLGEICTFLIKHSLGEKSTKDNVTVMIVQLTDGSSWASVPDEMKCFDKLFLNGSNPGVLEDDARRQYMAFLNKCNFPEKPCPCAQCGVWIQEMSQCPCKTINYCCKQCQKKGWKSHKANCPIISGAVAGGS